MINSPEIKLCIVGVSRDCFPISLTKSRLESVCEAAKEEGISIQPISVIIESEADTVKALAEAREMGANAAVVYLGNFGPEAPETIFAQKFKGPVMFAAAAEESKSGLQDGRGDAYCGMLNASYNLGLRNIRAYIPENPVGTTAEAALMIKDFLPVAKIYLGVKSLKVFGFGPRPADFFACNAPIKPFYNLGIEVMENSELDMLEKFNEVDENEGEVQKVLREMTKELGAGNKYPAVLPKLARFEVALMRFYYENLGNSSYGVFANKCWPAFEHFFGFVPCYVNSRLAAKGIPVACEVDLYGALSEYICMLATDMAPALLDLNNTVPKDMIKSDTDLRGAAAGDLFMGFHCGNVSSCALSNYEMKYQKIMKRLLEPDTEPDITVGTLEGTIRPGDITLFRLQGNAEGKLVSYIAEGEVLDMDPATFGGIGVFAVPEMSRFYRHVLIEKRFPHHGAVAFKKVGKILFEAVKLLGIEDVNYPLPKNIYYPTENPF